MWGTSSSSLYFVGNKGTIVFYNGTWQKLESGTTLNIRDIWGNWSEQAKSWEVLVIASSSETTDNTLLQILPNNTVMPLNTTGLSSFSTGIWFVPQKRYYIVGSGIHQKTLLSDPAWTRYEPGKVTSYASSAVHGQSLNDVFVTGSFLEAVHYNGSTWHNYRTDIPFSNGALGSVQIKGSTVAIVGYVNQQAIAMIGKR